jgi:glycosyltransferase involved in cell wall biosynthesis
MRPADSAAAVDAGRPPRVLFVASHWYPDAADPAAGVFVRRHAEAVAERCHVAVMAVTTARDPRAPATVLRDEGGIPTARVRVRDGGRPWTDLLLVRRVTAAVAPLVARLGGVDLVHYNVAPPAALHAAVAAALRRPPYVLTEHWSGYFDESPERIGRLRLAFLRRLTARAGAVTTVSDYLRRAMLARGLHGRYEVVPNAVDTRIFQPSPDGLRARGCRRLIAVGRVSRAKNVAGTIDVVTRLRHRHPDLELHVHGDGPELDGLRARVAATGIAAAVVLHGAGEPAVVASAMAASDLLVHFSDIENSPCVIGEAMACGLPVVATAVGGVPELVVPGAGELVPARDDVALEAAIERLVCRGEVYDRRRIRDAAVARFGYAAVGGRFHGIYRTVTR